MYSLTALLVWATSDDSSKTDLELLKEAELIEKTETNLTYDNNGNMRNEAQNENQELHEELVDELNSRRIFHKSQTIDNSLTEYEVTSTQTPGTDGNPIEVAILSSIENNIETNDSVCCGGTHDKKLAVKAGMEWSNEYFLLWKNRVESEWSAYSNGFASANVETVSGHSDLKMYFWTKSNHAVTTASASFTSDVLVRNSNGDWSSIDTNSKPFVNEHYGINIMAQTATLWCMVDSFGKIRKLSRMFHGVLIPKSTLNHFCDKVASELDPLYQEIKRDLNTGRLVNGDTTGRFINGQGRYVWVCGKGHRRQCKCAL